MVKNSLFAFGILTVSLLSCNVIIESGADPSADHRDRTPRVLSAVIEKPEGTKAVFDPKDNGGYKVFWTQKEKICVYYDDSQEQHIFTLGSGEGTSNGSFIGYGDATEIEALSPYIDFPSLTTSYERNNGATLVHVNYQQTYYPDTVDPSLLLMAGKGNAWDIHFHHLMSYLRIPVKGTTTLTSVELNSNGRDMPVYNAGPWLKVVYDETGTPALDTSSAVSAKLMYPTVLNCEDLVLDPVNVTNIIIAVIPQVFLGGFTITFKTPSGSITKTVEEDFAFERGLVHTAPITEITI